MTNEEKRRYIEKWLASQHIGYVRRYKHQWGKSDTFLPRYRVYIKIAGDDDEEFFCKHRVFPVFIRDEETAEFILEKVQSSIIKSMTTRQEVLTRKAERKQKGNRKKNGKTKIKD